MSPDEDAVPAERVARDSERSEVSDPHALRALAHPTRLRLLEALTREGPLTATQAANLLDDSPGNISWHLQTLAKYGFIEETGTGRGRSRPWRLVSLGQRFAGADAAAPSSVAADELAGLILEESVRRLRAWPSVRETFDPGWRNAAFLSQMLVYLTPGELASIEQEMTALVDRYRARTVDRARRPAGAAPVQIVAWGHPLEPSPSGS